jgi:glycerate 2-kinase
MAIVAALDAGCSDLLVGIGGSASTDGGAGMLAEVGVSLLDAHGQPVAPRPLELARIEQVDLSTADQRLRTARLRFAVDVDAPLTGPSGAAAVFGPQKGATADDVAALDQALVGWSELWPDVDAATPGAGAAGGVGFAALVLGAELVSGAEEFLALGGFGVALEAADVVLTGEGRLDRQTLMGKGPAVVARHANAAGVPTVAVVGARSEDVSDTELRAAGITGVHTLVDRLGEAAHDPARARAALTRIGEEVATATLGIRPGRG